jgi:hypothetical protein
MKIDVKDSAEFKPLLEALVDELIDAHDHFRLHQDLDAAIPDYQAEFEDPNSREAKFADRRFQSLVHKTPTEQVASNIATP